MMDSKLEILSVTPSLRALDPFMERDKSRTKKLHVMDIIGGRTVSISASKEKYRDRDLYTTKWRRVTVKWSKKEPVL